jgi:poly(3-hydroxybutyrate) depolymerase
MDIRAPALIALLMFGVFTASSAFSQEPAPQEQQCMAKGWKLLTPNIGGITRRLLWKGPAGAWSKGAIIVLHGGGGSHFQWCVANASLVQPQVDFSNLAISRGYAVFTLDSTAQVTDNDQRVCGKVWDDEVRTRPNLDLPFIEYVAKGLIPSLRPPASQAPGWTT